jgi:hypothetical protein
MPPPVSSQWSLVDYHTTLRLSFWGSEVPFKGQIAKYQLLSEEPTQDDSFGLDLEVPPYEIFNSSAR